MTVLYRFYDGEMRLLYVGITIDPLLRWGKHRRARWWKNVRHITLEHHATRKAAKAAETRAIRDERPLFNRAEKAPEVVVAPDPAKRYSCTDIVNELRELIESGKLPVGATFPSTKELSQAYRVSASTVTTAKRRLASMELIFGMAGSTTVVRVGQRLVRDWSRGGDFGPATGTDTK